MKMITPVFKPSIAYNRLSKPGQQGFIQAAILFGIALITAVIGGFAMANRTPASQTTVEQAKVNASVFIKQGADLREGMTRYVFDQGSVDSMKFDMRSGTGLFDPARQYAVVQIGPSRAYAGGTPTNTATTTTSHPSSGSYVLNQNVKVPDVGSTADDWVVAAVFDDTTTCQRINNMLYGRAIDATPPASGVASTVWTANSTPIDLSAVTALSGWAEGCVSATDSKMVYFKVVREI